MLNLFEGASEMPKRPSLKVEEPEWHDLQKYTKLNYSPDSSIIRIDPSHREGFRLSEGLKLIYCRESFHKQVAFLMKVLKDDKNACEAWVYGIFLFFFTHSRS